MFIAILVTNQYTSNLVDFNNDLTMCWLYSATQMTITFPVTFKGTSYACYGSTSNPNGVGYCTCFVSDKSSRTVSSIYATCSAFWVSQGKNYGDNCFLLLIGY